MPALRMILLPFLLAAALGPSLASALPKESDPMPSPPQTAACCAVVELRQYTLHPFKRDVLIDLFEHEFVDSQEAQGIRLIGTFRDLGNADRFVWMRGFADMPARAAALAAFYGGPAWQAHRERANATMVDSDNVMLLRPAHAGAGFAADAAPLAARGAVAIPLGLVEVRILYFSAPASTAQIDAIEAARDEALAAGHGVALALLVTEPAANNFPRLPVRTGEHAVVSVARFGDRAAYDRYLAITLAAGAWRTLLAELDGLAVRMPETLVLAPTARSRLPR